MLLGIDVGGTYTDAVLVDRGQVLGQAKAPTRGQDLLAPLLEALERVLEGQKPEKLRRIVLSTTLITNLMAERKYDPVGLLLLPGPGLPVSSFSLAAAQVVLQGAIDFRGREIISLDDQELSAAADFLARQGIRKVAVVGKFSQRNKSHEEKVGACLRKGFPNWDVELGHQVAGQLNFPRRVATTLLNTAVKEAYSRFAGAVREALLKEGIRAPVYILKGDGGTIPLEQSLAKPVETLFSGPAASVLGVMALTPPGQTVLMMDIGGTTTDLAIILSGRPLMASRGAKIEEHLTQVRSFSVKAVPIGGDSRIRVRGREILVGPERQGPAYCLGGPEPTPTDALRTLGLIDYGDAAKAGEAMVSLGRSLGLPAREMARQVLEAVVTQITGAVKALYAEWEQEPAYRVWEFLQRGRIEGPRVVGIGGAAGGMVPQIAQRLGYPVVVPPFAAVANALGAAVAKPTLAVSLRLDTEQKTYSLYEEGIQGPLERIPRSQEEALALARAWLARRGRQIGDDLAGEDYEILHNEVFNIIRGGRLVGKVYFVSLQTPWQITDRVETGGGPDYG